MARRLQHITYNNSFPVSSQENETVDICSKHIFQTLAKQGQQNYLRFLQAEISNILRTSPLSPKLVWFCPSKRIREIWWSLASQCSLSLVLHKWSQPDHWVHGILVLVSMCVCVCVGMKKRLQVSKISLEILWISVTFPFHKFSHWILLELGWNFFCHSFHRFQDTGYARKYR